MMPKSVLESLNYMPDHVLTEEPLQVESKAPTYGTGRREEIEL